MSKKVYKTAQGKTVDLGALQLQNENVRAVGNMGVNARGDKVNPQNTSVDSRNASVNRHYKKQTHTNVSDEPVISSKKEIKKQTTPKQETSVAEPQIVEEPINVTDTESVGGLAGAIAKARSIKQEPMKTPRQIAQSQSGVKKI